MLQPTPLNLLLRLASTYSFGPFKSAARRRLKQQHELWACHTLLNLLSPHHAKLTVGNPHHHQPDIITTLDQQTLGIEVTTVYYDQDQAKQAWDELQGQVAQPDQALLDQLHQTDQVLIYNTQQALNRKADKNYQSYQQLWLLVVISQPFKSIQTATKLPHILHPPVNFDDIYLLYQQSDSPDYHSLHLGPTTPQTD